MLGLQFTIFEVVGVREGLGSSWQTLLTIVEGKERNSKSAFGSSAEAGAPQFQVRGRKSVRTARARDLKRGHPPWWCLS